METPNFVRLANRLTSGMVTDMESGWSIAGLDVRTVPDKKKDPAARRFIRKALLDGRLEPASQAEWDEVHETSQLEDEALMGRPQAGVGGIQEAHVRRAAEEGSSRIKAARVAADAERNQDDVDDDDEEDDEDDDEEITIAPVKAKSPKKKSTSSKKKSK